MKYKPMKSISFRKLLPKGSVLVFSLLILSIMLVTSLTILSSAVLDRKASLSTGSSTRSFQVADSGVEEVLYQIYKGNRATLEDVRSSIGNGATCANGVIEFPVAGGTARVTFYQDATTVYAGPCSGGTATDWRDKVVKIKSEGTVGSTTRAVEVAVAASSITCPSGWTLIGGGGFGSYCIENNERAAQSYDNALNICGGVQPSGYGYAHLCDDIEWHTACQHPAGLSDMTNNWEMISERDNDANSLFVGNGGCLSDTQGNGNTNFRCCLR